MSQSLVMTKKERLSGVLEKHDAMQSLLAEIRILEKFNKGQTLITERIARKQALLNKLWVSGNDKYIYNTNGTKV